ncbi:MAG: sigma 54-interacting transcriptional regulator [Sandaracinaceae bacterium]|nr:sigma 54-interacting transcriptional regulator [Sandaracinaceae bacterium]
MLRAADGGTLFLDEIGDLPLDAQAKLGCASCKRKRCSPSASRPVALDVRVACATHRDLEDLVAGGSFRGDLLARLREFGDRAAPAAPPARRRAAAAAPLPGGRGPAGERPEFSLHAGAPHYDWPHNVREMESAVRLSVALRRRHGLDLRHLPKPSAGGFGRARAACRAPSTTRATTPRVRPRVAGTPPDEVQLRLALAEHRGNVAAVGRVFGKERMQVHRWMRRCGINAEDYRA